jgi:pilus assembly protein CpaD
MSKRSNRRFDRGAPFAALAIAIVVFGCQTDSEVTGSFPVEYAERHPIRLTEGQHAIQLLIGAGRGDLTASQRAQVTQMVGSWHREGTGVFLIEVPTGTPNARAAKYASREVQSLLRASGVPARGITTRSYPSPAPDSLGPLRISYTRVVAEAGPCGDWPEDIGAAPRPTLTPPYPPSWDNRPHWNFGCATQANLAAMVANPEDLIQPRAETRPLAARRQTVIDKYRKGENPSGQYETKDAKASTVGAQ